MRDTVSANRSPGRPLHRSIGGRVPNPIVLWRLRGATDDLRGLVFVTSFGYALGLELAAELILLHLPTQSYVPRRVCRSHRVRAARPRVATDRATHVSWSRVSIRSAALVLRIWFRPGGEVLEMGIHMLRCDRCQLTVGPAEIGQKSLDLPSANAARRVGDRKRSRCSATKSSASRA